MAYKSARVKPKIRVKRTGPDDNIHPFMFFLLWPRNHWQNSQWFTFQEAIDELQRECVRIAEKDAKART